MLLFEWFDYYHEEFSSVHQTEFSFNYVVPLMIPINSFELFVGLVLHVVWIANVLDQFLCLLLQNVDIVDILFRVRILFLNWNWKV